MIIEHVSSTTMPQSVIREDLPDSRPRILLSKDVEEITTEEGVSYEYKAAEFYLPEGRDDSVQEIEANMAAWWAYASVEHPEPTVEERLEALEDIVYGG